MSLEPVTISKQAAKEIEIIKQSDAIPDDHFLRIGVKEGGCGTGGFTIGFDTKRDSDLAYINHGVQIYVDKKHVMYLMGVEVDYKENDDEWGFVFNNLDEGK